MTSLFCSLKQSNRIVIIINMYWLFLCAKLCSYKSTSEVLTHLSSENPLREVIGLFPFYKPGTGVSERFVNFFRSKGKDERVT